MMKKRNIWIILMLAIVFFPTKVCYAGNINENEAAVLAVATGTFQCEGKTYRAKDSYVAKLKAKLEEDGTDLTASESQEAIDMIYGNISVGIAEGYLELVGGQEGKKKQDAATTAVKKDVNIAYDDTSKEYIAKDKDSGEVVIRYHQAIKETGYSYVPMIWAGGILGILLIGSIWMIIRQTDGKEQHEKAKKA